MCVIDWCSFTWQAFATLLAAAGAVIIGWRQVGIARRQAEIADGQKSIAAGQAETARASLELARASMEIVKTQAHTARLAQRTSLFERRLKAYETVQDYLQTALRGNFDGLIDLTPRVRDALQGARFLFPGSVEKAFLEAFELADECALLIEDRRERTTGGTADPERLKELRHKLRDILGTLSVTMGDEMRLFFDPESTPTPAAVDTNSA